MRTVRVGIIGCGVIAPCHADAFTRLDGVEVTWACDLLQNRVDKLASDFSIPNTTNEFRTVLADPDVDAISICTDHGSHAEIAVAALSQAKHVLCEKALGASTADLDAMIDAHKHHPELIFAAIFQHRFDHVYRYLKTIIQDGKLGRILTADLQMHCLRTNAYYAADTWRGTWEQEGGSVLMNQAIHFVDILNWVMGGVESLCGEFANLTHTDVIETEDTAVAALRFRNGALGTISATASSHLGWDQIISIYGDAGTIEIRAGQCEKAEFSDKVIQDEVATEFARLADQKSEVIGKAYYGPSHPAQIEDFVNAIRNRTQPFVTAESARGSVDLALAIYEAHRTRGWITL